ncbi:hypothetical protein ECDEC7C_1835 [Escherichia coli DEC7C]|nr:hypothetical protein ECDEC7C_1835 [Escherichia coli DEC7C]
MVLDFSHSKSPVIVLHFSNPVQNYFMLGSDESPNDFGKNH